jgi:tetratricopeptide (TPR) repeat protein
LADVYCLQKNKEKAVEILMPLVDEQNPHACCQYSHMLFNEKKYDDAEKYAIIAIMAGDVIATQVLGHIYITTKQFDKIQEYEKYIKIAVDKENEHLDALYNGNKFLCHFMILGRMYHLAGNITKAIEMYDSITDPYEITIFIEKAMLYLQNNEENKAYEQLDLFEENDGFKKLKSKMYKSKGNIKEMIVLIQLQRYYALNNIDKFLQYLFICSPKEQASVIRKLKLSQIID